MESSPYVFRPINDSPDVVLRNSVTSPVRQGKCLYGVWRNNPENRSNSRHSTTSRPGSSATNSRPPSSNIYYPLSNSTNNSSSTLYCKSSNNSLTDVLVTRNFQQLSVSNRRAAFKGYEIQKWSSFDGKKRRPINSLDSENTGSSLDLKSEERSVVSPVEIARRELQELLRNQEGVHSVQKSTSLPSFPESFNGFLGKSLERSIDEQLDDEIKMIVAKAERVKEEDEVLLQKVTRNQAKHHAVVDSRSTKKKTPSSSTNMHLEALMQLPYLNDAVSPGDQNASISPLCSPHPVMQDAPLPQNNNNNNNNNKFIFPSMHHHQPKDEEWSQDYGQYFPQTSMDTSNHHPLNTNGGLLVQQQQQQQQMLPLQRSQPQEIMNTFDEAFFNAFTDGLQSNFDSYPLDTFPSPPRSGYSSPAVAIQPPLPSEDYSMHSSVAAAASSSFDPYFLTVPEDPQEAHSESHYEYYPPIKSDPQMGGMDSVSSSHPEILEEMTDSLGSHLPGSPDSTIKEELLEPMGASEDSGVYTCLWVDCGEEFENQERLVDHVNGIHMETKKGCEELPCLWKDCPRQLKPFNAKYKLLTHMRVHTREKPYKCNFENCDRAFARLENKKIHFRSHTGQKPFNCKYSKEFNCTKKFSNSSDRAKHEQTHKDPKPYRCEVVGCCKRYTDPSSLRKHVKSHSQEEQVQYRKAKDLANAAKRTSSPSSSGGKTGAHGSSLPSVSPISWNTPVSLGGGLNGAGSLPSESMFMESKVFQSSSSPCEIIFPKFAQGLNETSEESILSNEAIMYTTTTSVAQNIRRPDPLSEEELKCHSYDPLAFRYDHHVDCGSYDLQHGNWCS